MLITLFDNQKLINEATRLTKQIQTKKFTCVSLDYCLNELQVDSNKVQEVTDSIEPYLNKEREYCQIGNAASDNLFFMEALGLDINARDYIVILDFSERLDYVLHRLCKCSMEAIRKMPNYSRVSKAVLNLDKDNLADISLANFYGLDNKLDEFLDSYLLSVSDNIYGIESIAETITSNFLYDVLNELARIKDYCVIALADAKKQDAKFIYKSKNFSSVLATSERPVAEDLEITSEGYDTCVISVQSYARMEYALKGEPA